MFDKALEEVLSKSQNPDEIYSDIVSHYITLLNLLGVNHFDTFQFADYEDPRSIIVDGNAYHFDDKFCYDDRTETEMLCAIDCLIADLEEGTETVLKKTENKINAQNKKRK